ncbi:MAG: hypothetical protein ACI4BD_04085 [Paludibacteraceae bacterium]
MAAVASFVIESKTSVSASGELPAGATATYECTYKKGQLTAGNSATLRLSGWQSTEISRVTLWMKSNQASGAGNLRMTIDGTEVWTIPTQPFSDWAGAYSTEYVPIAHTFSPAAEVQRGEVSVCVSATENSLYIERYEVEWQQTAARPYTVVLIEDGYHVYAQLSEQSVGSGVVLPALADADDWHFSGWSETAIADASKVPALVQAGTTYYPVCDTKLYAVYTDYLSQEVPTVQQTDFQSGDYAIAFSLADMGLVGPVDEAIGGIPAQSVSLLPREDGLYERQYTISENMVYHIDFYGDSTARITHVQTQTPVGYSGNQLARRDELWHYQLAADSSVCFYVPLDTARVRALRVYFDDNDLYLVWKGGLVTCMRNQLHHHSLLFTVDTAAFHARWTSFPYGQGIEQSEQEDDTISTHDIQIGNYRLRIRHGKKYLLLEH